MRNSRYFLLTLMVALSACRHGEPPAPTGIDASIAPLPPPPGVSSASGAAIPATPATSASAAPPVADTAADGGDPGALPQTHDKAKAEGDAFAARSRALWDGIASDDPDRALPFFFPLSAYRQVKDVGSPASDWKNRLVAAYKRDIHALHARLGEKADDAKLVRFEVPDDRAKWVEPGEEYNKLGYWRVYGTRIVYKIGDEGRERTFEVSSLISWRGEWYVVHLTGFK